MGRKYKEAWSGLKTLVGSTAKFGQDLVCVNNKASIRFFGILGLTFGALGLASYTIRKMTNNHRVSAFLHAVAFGMTAYIYSPPADEFQIYIENYLLKKLILAIEMQLRYEQFIKGSRYGGSI